MPSDSAVRHVPASVPPDRIQILNGRFDRLSSGQTVEALIGAIHARERGVLATVNVAILMMMRSDPGLQRFVDRARWTVADGQPLVWASRLWRQPLPERVTGIDLIDQLCARAVQDGIGVYFLGADSDTLGATVAVLRNRHRGLDVRGYADGYFEAGQAGARARAIADSGAKLLFVAMGVPRQEQFIEEQWDHLGAQIVIGVGGSFDVISGRKRRAPAFLQHMGLEWAFRLAQEPRRLFRRYLVTNSQFLGLISWSAIARIAHVRPAPARRATPQL